MPPRSRRGTRRPGRRAGPGGAGTGRRAPPAPARTARPPRSRRPCRSPRAARALRRAGRATAARAVLPMPAGPDTNSVRPWPALAAAISRSMRPSSASRPSGGAPAAAGLVPGRRAASSSARSAATAGPGRDAELAAQRSLQPLQLPQRPAPVAAVGELPRDGQAGILVGRVGAGEILPPAGAAQHLLVQLAQPVPWAVQPRLVRVLGQQVPGPQLGCGSRRGCIRRRCRGASIGGEGPLGAPLERLGVDCHIGVREQRHGVPGEDQRPRITQRAPGVVRGLVQPWRRVAISSVGPQRVDDLLAVQRPARGQREELDQRRRLAAAPLARRGRPARRRGRRSRPTGRSRRASLLLPRM